MNAPNSPCSNGAAASSPCNRTCPKARKMRRQSAVFASRPEADETRRPDPSPARTASPIKVIICDCAARPDTPSCGWNVRIRRRHHAWNVRTSTAVMEADANRADSSRDALRVNVRHRTDSGAKPTESRCKTRWMSVSVLPAPAGAKIMSAECGQVAPAALPAGCALTAGFRPRRLVNPSQEVRAHNDPFRPGKPPAHRSYRKGAATLDRQRDQTTACSTTGR
eukprot:scaffold121119_cov28-Tisochrysis_lutea.AAC.1